MENTSSLADTLRKCVAEKFSYCQCARSYVPRMQYIVNSARQEVERAKDSYDESSLVCDDLRKSLRKQARASANSYDSDISSLERIIDDKARDQAAFNIVLFGRTMVGKSTLMSVLTHGNYSAIGVGQQRTTTNVRTYGWKGLTVTDVPGIDASGNCGAMDEDMAMDAARRADLIVFLISDGQPEKTEADWFCKLRDLDKAMLCLINCKKSISGVDDRDDFLCDPGDEVFDKVRLKAIGHQSLEFIRQTRPTPSMTFFAVHLEAERQSLDSSFPQEVKQSLHNASRFSVFEQKLTSLVAQKGTMLKLRSFMTDVDGVLYSQAMKFRGSCSLTYAGLQDVNDTLGKFSNWQKRFNQKEYEGGHNQIDILVDKLKNSIPAFLDDNIECEDINNRLKMHLASFNVEDQMCNILKSIASRMQNDIEGMFRDLRTDLSVSYHQNSKFDLGSFDTTDFKSWWSMVAAAGGIALALSGPVGWTLIAIGTIFSLFSDSKEEKIREAKRKALKEINEALEKNRQNLHGFFTKVWYGDLKSAQSTAYGSLKHMQNSMSGLLNFERRYYFQLLDLHRDAMAKMVSSSLKNYMSEADIKNYIGCVARVPGKKILVGTRYDCSVGKIRNSLADLDLQNESLATFLPDPSLSTNCRVELALSYFRLPRHFSFKKMKNDAAEGQLFVLYDLGALDESQKDDVMLIEQVLNVHFIQHSFR